MESEKNVLTLNCIKYMNVSPIVSVIIPVFNSERLLKRCVDSVLKQTYTHFELLLVDDGSTDGSADICDKYASVDERVRTFHKLNGGVSSARNLGLQEAKGKYLTFIDSDDWIETVHLELLINHMETRDWVMVWIKNVTDGKIRELKGIPKIYNADTVQAVDEICSCIPQFGYVTNKLYRSSLIRENRILFAEDTHIHEDRIFNITYVQYVKSFIMLPNVSYNYMDDNGDSITHIKYNPPHLYVKTAERMNSLILNANLGTRMQKGVARVMFNHYVHALGCCMIYPPSKMSLSDRSNSVKKIYHSMKRSVIPQRFRMKSITWLFQDLLYYTKRLVKLI
jgi:glycosyltransferase involved in cell wall biosynthesis